MMKCSAKAFAACPTRHLCIGDATFTEGSECDKLNRMIEKYPVTNADVIRAMSDDGLTDIFYDAVAGTIESLLEILQIPLTVDEVVNQTGYKKTLKTWLQKQAKEDGNGFALSDS